MKSYFRTNSLSAPRAALLQSSQSVVTTPRKSVFWFRHLASAAVISWGLLASPAQAETDYGEVSMYVAKALQDQHYIRRDFDKEMAQRTLNHYINTLDWEHKFFLQSDIDAFEKDYKDRLDSLVLTGDLSPALRIYSVFEQRVKERVAAVSAILKEGKFDFGSAKTIEISRKKLGWPKDIAESDELWHRTVTNELLTERLNKRYKDEKEKEKAAKPKDPAQEAKDKEKAESATPKKPAPPQDPPEERIRKRYEKFAESLQENDAEEKANFFISALSVAYDPHSEYFSEAESQNFMISMKNKLIGIGALLQKKEEGVEISGLVIGGPADKAGTLKEGDKIVGVAQGEEGKMEDVRYLKLQKIVDKIRGEKASTVRLQVVPGDDPGSIKEIQLIREEVELKDKVAQGNIIDLKGDDGKVLRLGYIQLPAFYADMENHETSCTEDIRRILTRMKAEGIMGLVLDFRGNGGGSLEEAINLTGLFLPRGPVVQVVDWRKDQPDRKISPNLMPMYTGPLVIATDKTSASASEICAAALQDTGRAVVVGDDSTFGKGTVQTIIDMKRIMPYFSDSKRAGALKVTIQKFYRIAGGSTQLRGVIPDIKIPSRVEAYDIGEDELENPLEYDTINAAKFNMWTQKLPMDELSSRSKNRVTKEPEFTFVQEDVKRLEEQIKKNTLSLNEVERWDEVQKNKVRRQERIDARKKRIEAFSQTEKDKYTVYRLTLDTVDKPLKLESAFTDEDNTGMRMAKDDEAEDEKIKFPWDLEPLKLENIHILEDLVKLTGGTTTAAVEAPKETK